MDMTQTRFFLLLFASLETLAVQIYNCANNKVEIFEDAPVNVTCGGIVSDRDVTWRRGDGVYIGVCNADGTSCTNTLYNDYTLSRSPQSTESRLTLLPEYRRHAGVTVSCTDSVSTASCTLVIRRHTVLSECDVTTNTVSGNVSGSCRVQGAYSSDNDYNCSWSVNNQSFGAFDSTRETCSFTQPLPQDSGLYNYTIAVFPPSTAGFSKNVIIAPTSSSRTSATDVPLDTRWIIVGVIIAITFIAIIIAGSCVVIKRRNLKCLGFQDHVNVVYSPSDDQRQQLKESEEPYYSTADMVPGEYRPAAGETQVQGETSPVCAAPVTAVTTCSSSDECNNVQLQ